MQVLRLYDPARRPASWTDVIGREQFAAFAKDLATGAPCDGDGRPLADPDAATCTVFDSLAHARSFCEDAVSRAPSIRFDIFDADGRANPPLLTVLHPERAAALDTSPRQLHRRRVVAWCLLLGGVPVMIFAYAVKDAGHAVFPGFIGLNMLLIGGRLLWFNLGVRETERLRQQRLDKLNGG